MRSGESNRYKVKSATKMLSFLISQGIKFLLSSYLKVLKCPLYNLHVSQFGTQAGGMGVPLNSQGHSIQALEMSVSLRDDTETIAIMQYGCRTDYTTYYKHVTGIYRMESCLNARSCYWVGLITILQCFLTHIYYFFIFKFNNLVYLKYCTVFLT